MTDETSSNDKNLMKYQYLVRYLVKVHHTKLELSFKYLQSLYYLFWGFLYVKKTGPSQLLTLLVRNFYIRFSLISITVDLSHT